MSLLSYMKPRYRVLERISNSDMEDFYIFRKLLLEKLNSTVKITYLDTDGKAVVNSVYKLGNILIRDLVWELKIIGEKQLDLKEFNHIKENIVEKSKKLFKNCASISIYSPIIPRKYRVMATEIILRKMGFSKIENSTIQTPNGPENISFIRGNIAIRMYQNSIEVFSKDLSIRDTIAEEFRKTCEKIFGFNIFDENLQVFRKEEKITQIFRRISTGYGRIAITCDNKSYVLYVSGSPKPLLDLIKKFSANNKIKIVFDVRKYGYRFYGILYIKNFLYNPQIEKIRKRKKMLKNKITKLYKINLTKQ